MALFTKLRSRTLLLQVRNFCSPSAILCDDPKVILTAKEKSWAALSLLKLETNPEKILNICRAAALTPEYHVDRTAFSAAISRLSKLNYFEGIRVYLEELKNRPDLRNERFFSYSIVLYGQAGMIPNAITTFEQMEQMGIRRTVRSFNSLLFSCLVAKKYDEAKRIFTDFPSMYNIEPNIGSYNTIIEVFSKAGESMSGYSIIAEMSRKKCKPTPTTFANLIAGFYKEEKFEDVGKVLNLMKEHGITPGPRIYGTRIQSLCKLGRSFEAKSLLDGMIEEEMKINPYMFRNLIYGFCKEGKYEDAKKLFKSMAKYGCKPDGDCYFTIIYYLCKSGDYETALRILKASMAKKWFPNLTTMKSLVEGLVSISKVEEAKELIEKVKEQFPKQADQWKETEEKLSGVAA